MRNRVLLIVLVIACWAGSGCTRGPHGTLFSGQQKLESATQWNVLANHVADRINKELLRQHYLDASVYVRHGRDASGNRGSGGISPFDDGFNDLLTTQLINFGINVVTSPEHASLIVEYKMEAVYHPSENWIWNKDAHGHYEVIFTTFILDRNRYVMRSSDIYAIDSADFWQYWRPAPAAEIRLTGSHAAPRTDSTTATSL